MAPKKRGRGKNCKASQQTRQPNPWALFTELEQSIHPFRNYHNQQQRTNRVFFSTQREIMQLFVWALSIAGLTVLSTATPVATPKPKHLPSTTTTFPPSVSSLIPTLSATPHIATSTTTFIRQTKTDRPGIPLPPSTVTAQPPTRNPVRERGCKPFSSPARPPPAKTFFFFASTSWGQ